MFLFQVLAPSSFFYLPLAQLLLVSLWEASYLDLQPIFGKHINPRRLGDDSLSPRGLQWSTPIILQ
jgi:hypothetical protein